MAGEAYQSGQSGLGELGLYRVCFHHVGSAVRHGRSGSLRVGAGPVWMPVRRMRFRRRISWMRGCCISYLTIEHKGPVDEDLRAKLGNRIYGCDDCLAACPWNKFAVAASDLRYAARDDSESACPGGTGPTGRRGVSREVFRVTDQTHRAGSVCAQCALCDRQLWRTPALKPVAQGLTEDPDPTVADAARWAVKRLS